MIYLESIPQFLIFSIYIIKIYVVESYHTAFRKNLLVRFHLITLYIEKIRFFLTKTPFSPYFSKTPFFKCNFVTQFQTPVHNEGLCSVTENFTNWYFLHKTFSVQKCVFPEGEVKGLQQCIDVGEYFSAMVWISLECL